MKTSLLKLAVDRRQPQPKSEQASLGRDRRSDFKMHMEAKRTQVGHKTSQMKNKVGELISGDFRPSYPAMVIRMGATCSEKQRDQCGRVKSPL